MKKAYLFPGQGAQYSGMGKDLYDSLEKSRAYFNKANKILNFSITDIMFNGSDKELTQTKVTQPAVFLASVIPVLCLENLTLDMVAGHSLGEFSALVANRCLSFEEGLLLVYKRALAMQKACEATSSSMIAIIGLSGNEVARICNQEKNIYAANFNTPDQTVISGHTDALQKASDIFKKLGAKHIMPLNVSGAFHSPYMQTAAEELSEAIHDTRFSIPICPIYQNVDAKPHTLTNEIKRNLIEHLTSPIRWSESIIAMHADKASVFIESGPGNILQGLVKRILPQVERRHL